MGGIYFEYATTIIINRMLKFWMKVFWSQKHIIGPGFSSPRVQSKSPDIHYINDQSWRCMKGTLISKIFRNYREASPFTHDNRYLTL